MNETLRYPNEFSIRQAVKADTPLIFSFIKRLADYVKESHLVVADEAELGRWIFDENRAEVVFGEVDGEAVGFALFYTTFSTFLGRPCTYLEDLFVLPETRGKGYGKLLLSYVAEQVQMRGYGRFEWCCLDWNTPSIEFYLSLGAEPQSERTRYRLAGGKLDELARFGINIRNTPKA